MLVVARIAAGMILVLAAAGPAAAAQHYTVAPHDTLYSIARRFHVPVPALVHVNGLRDPDRIRPGDVLLIPDAPAAGLPGAPGGGGIRVFGAVLRSPSPVAARGAVVPPHEAPGIYAGTYIVRPGDTLFRIARAHGTTVAALATANHLASPEALRAGQMLRVPQPSGPARAAAVPASVVAARPAVAPTPVPTAPGPRGPAVTPAPGDAADDLPGDSPRTSAGSSSGPSPDSGRLPGGTLPEPVVQAPGAPASGVAAPGGPSPGTTPIRQGWVPPLRTTELGHRVSTNALGYLGTPYVWGGASRTGVDCSGLVFLVYSRYVSHLARTSYDQWLAGTAVNASELAQGDLVFFNTDGSGASHVGIYIGDGRFVHPAASAQRVVIDRLDDPYYTTHYLGARRLL